MNVKKSFMQITTYLFYAIAGIQIVFGLLYLCANLFSTQYLQGSLEYLDVSKTLLTDEYIGILYPLLLRIPPHTLIYLLQLGAAAAALWLLTGVLWKTGLHSKKRIVWTLYLLTLPMLMQLHMSILPNSFAFSAIVVFLTFFLKERSWKNAVVMGVMALAAALLLPDTLFITGFLSLLGILIDMIKRRICLKEWAIWILSLVVAVSVGTAIQTPGSRGRIQKTFWAAMFQRTVSEYFSQSFMVWDDKVQTSFTIDEFIQCAKRSDNMMYVVGPKLEQRWGKETANELYKSMTYDCMRLRTRQVVYGIGDDLADSIAMPFSVLWEKNGRISATGANYEEFRKNWPQLAAVYFYFGVYSQILLLAVKVIRSFWNKVRINGKYFIILAAALIQVMVAVMSSANAVDYTGLWLMVLFWGMII